MTHQEKTTVSAKGSPPTTEMVSLRRLLPVAALAAGAALFFSLGLHKLLTFEALREHRELLLGWVKDHSVAAIAVYIIGYAVAVVFVPPSGTVITLAGGFVFGAAVGGVSVVIGATIGATALFLVVRYSARDMVRRLDEGALQKMADGFRRNEMSYMLFLRLIPLFPFWLVNIAPAFLGVRLRTFVLGTFIGIIPGVAVYSTVGAGLGGIFDADGEFSPAGVMTPEIIAGLIGLAVLSLAPVAYKKYKARRA